jgi:hypothetical protein
MKAVGLVDNRLHAPGQRMAVVPRPASLVLVLGGTGLLALMGYALFLGGELWGPLGRHQEPFEVAVFYPETASWHSVLGGARLAQSHHAVELMKATQNEILMRMPRTGRAVRLRWFNSRGGVDTRLDLARAVGGPQPPRTVVGSSNTVLTLSLAKSLNSMAEDSSDRSPEVLLITDATSVREPQRTTNSDNPSDTDHGALFLDAFPQHSFRFCLNNQALAHLLVRYEVEARKVVPDCVMLVVDASDPYSIDFASCVESEIERRALKTSLVRRPIAFRSDEGGPPTHDEVSWASEVAELARANPGQDPVWVVMALQGQPARRCLHALEKVLTLPEAQKLRVISGDGMGLLSLEQLAGRLSFVLTCASSLTPLTGEAASADEELGSQIHAEWIIALSKILDQPGTERNLTEALRKLDLSGNDSLAIADRPIAFVKGERVGDSLGSVLEVLPVSGRVHAHSLSSGSGSAWTTLTWVGNHWRAQATSIDAMNDKSDP